MLDNFQNKKYVEEKEALHMIWCVEDDASIRDIEIYALQTTGFQARGFETGTEFWEALQNERPELVLLDVMLLGIDGVELLRRMKNSVTMKDIPVIMATAKGSEYDKIQSLDLGADDYLVKPFGIMEMVSRVRAVLRRCRREQPASLLTAEALVLDQEAHTVTVEGQRITLTHKEYELLRLLLARPGVAFTRDQLLGEVWGTEFYGETRTVDMHIRTLRQKLGPMAHLIETVRGVGYRLEKAHD